MGKVKLAPPWITLFNEIKAMFGNDPDITVEYNEDNNDIRLYVNGQEKADAITQLLPTERKYGNVVVKVTVVPANKLGKEKLSLFRKAFEGNPAFSYVKDIPGVFSVSYVVFKNKVVQFFDDNLGDINGNRSTLYEEIARDIFEDVAGIYFCTDVEEPVYNK